VLTLSPRFRALLARLIPDRHALRFTVNDHAAYLMAEDIESMLDIIYTLEVPDTASDHLYQKNAIAFVQGWEIVSLTKRIR